MKSILKNTANTVLNNFGIQIVRAREESKDFKPWDKEFLQWISEAEASGRDPNDVGDVKWDGNPLIGIEKYLNPYIGTQAVVLEFGPGSGRYTRHIISRCRKMLLVDYSAVVCEWLTKYLKGKGEFSVHKIDRPVLHDIGESVADMGFANGVFEHIDVDETYEFLKEFYRVLRPGGVFWFNFNTLQTSQGVEWFKQERSKLQPGDRSIFRFYHPDDIKCLAEGIGFTVLKVHMGNNRLISIHLQKPEGRE
jgi:SAM-dependent methyltransferase